MYRRGRASRTVVVTGSASGLGRALRHRLGADGWRVIGVDLVGEEVEADLGSPRGRAAAMNEVLGHTRRVIDGLVLCAGLGPREADGARLVAVNYFGSVEVLDGLRPGLAAGTRPAAVVVVPGTVGLLPAADAGLVDLLCDGGEAISAVRAGELEPADVHAMTKLALTRAVRRRALEWGRSGIRLNAVARGPFPSPPVAAPWGAGAGRWAGGRPAERRGADHPAERRGADHPAERRGADHPAGAVPGDGARPFGRLEEALPVPLDRRVAPDDVAGVVSFLLGPDASMVHGAVVFSDGGTDAALRPDHV